jgi:hypothetical protein
MSQIPVISFCGSCGEPIYWLANSLTRKIAPIETKPAENGNVLLFLDLGLYRVTTDDEREAYKGWLHLSHFVNCPQAPVWREVSRR